MKIELEQLLIGSGIELAFSFDGSLDSADLSTGQKQVLLSLVLIARDFGAREQCVDLTISSVDSGTSMACMFRSETGETQTFEDDLAFRMLKRLIRMQGGEVTTTKLDRKGFVQISCTVLNESNLSDATSPAAASFL